MSLNQSFRPVLGLMWCDSRPLPWVYDLYDRSVVRRRVINQDTAVVVNV